MQSNSSPPPPGWWAACWSQDLRPGRVMARALWNVSVALFRGPDGRIGALEDRCPHRNAPLSQGRVLPTGTLECAYHGWSFETDGRCSRVPGLPQSATACGKSASTLPVQERDGVVWVALGARPEEPPVALTHANDPGWRMLRFELVFDASMANVAENILDVPHTSFVHGSIFRDDGPRRPVEMILRRGVDRVEAEFIAEPRPQGLIGRLLAPGTTTVRHLDRFIMPAMTQFEYGSDESQGLFATHMLTPEGPNRTRSLSAVAVKLDLPWWFLRPVLQLYARAVFKQDSAMLSHQLRVMTRHGGERFASTDLDVIGAHVRQLMAGRGEPGAQRRLTVMM